MATQTIATAQATLKEVWGQDDVTKQYDEGALFLDIIEHGSQESPGFINQLGTYDGKYVIFPLHTAGNPNVAVGIAEGYQYTADGSQTYTQAKYRCKFLGAAIGFTSQVMSRANGGERSVFDVAAAESSKTLMNIRRRMNFSLARNGSGILGTSGVSSTAGWDNSAKTLTVNSTANFQVGMEIILRDPAQGNASGVPSGNTTTSLPTAWLTTSCSTGEPMLVTAIDATNAKLTVTRYDGSAWTGDINPTHGTNTQSFGVYLWDDQGRSPWGIDNFCEVVNPANMGYNAATTITAVDDGSLLNVPGAIDRTLAAASYWKAIGNSDMTTNLGGSKISIENDIQPLIAQIITRDSQLTEDRGEGETVGSIVAVSRMGPWWDLVNVLNSGQRTDVRTRIVDGRYSGVHYDFITFCYDQTVDSGNMWFFAPRYLFRMVCRPWGVENYDGEYHQVLGTMQRGTSNWRKYLVSEQQLCGSSCRPNAKFTNLG